MAFSTRSDPFTRILRVISAITADAISTHLNMLPGLLKLHKHATPIMNDGIGV